MLLLVYELYLELSPVVLRDNPYLLERLDTAKVFRNRELDVPFAVVVLFAEFLCNSYIDRSVFLYSATAALYWANHKSFLVLVTRKMDLFGIASAFFQNK